MPDIDEKELGAIEWELLPMFDRFSGESAKTLERSLAIQPSFFVEVIKGSYRGKGEPTPDAPEGDEKKKQLDANEHDDMRRGYPIELFNRRGAYFVAGGWADREQQKRYEERAKKMNDAGFTNIAATLRSMADEYGYSAERAEKSSDPDL